MEIIIKWFGSEVNLDCVKVWDFSIDYLNHQIPTVGDYLELDLPITQILNDYDCDYKNDYWTDSWLFKASRREWSLTCGRKVILEVKMEDPKIFFKIPEEARNDLKKMLDKEQKSLEQWDF